MLTVSEPGGLKPGEQCERRGQAAHRDRAVVPVHGLEEGLNARKPIELLQGAGHSTANKQVSALTSVSAKRTCEREAGLLAGEPVVVALAALVVEAARVDLWTQDWWRPSLVTVPRDWSQEGREGRRAQTRDRQPCVNPRARASHGTHAHLSTHAPTAQANSRASCEHMAAWQVWGSSRWAAWAQAHPDNTTTRRTARLGSPCKRLPLWL